MALEPNSKLVPTPSSTGRPVDATFVFEVEVVDLTASRPKDRTLELALSDTNDLVFAGGGKKLTKVVAVGSRPVPLEFRKKITGTGADLSSFRVALREAGANDPLVTCRVDLG